MASLFPKDPLRTTRAARRPHDLAGGITYPPSHRHTHLRGFATHPHSLSPHTRSVTSHTQHSSPHALRASQFMRRARRLSPLHHAMSGGRGYWRRSKSPKSGMPCSMCANPPHSRTRRGRAGFSKCGRSPTTARAGVGTVLVRLCARSAIGDRVVIACVAPVRRKNPSFSTVLPFLER